MGVYHHSSPALVFNSQVSKLHYTAVSMLWVPLNMVWVVASELGPARDGVGFELFRSSCQKVARGKNPFNYR
jgi:hypothetical protein